MGADRDLAVAVDPRRERPTRLERLFGQRSQQRALVLEVLIDGPRPRADPVPDVVPVPLLDQLVQLRKRLDLRDGSEVVAAEVANLALDSAFSWAPSMPGRQ
ncbi:hypothetical protein [Streptomyces sp. NPDC005322]|uniref:hypothetical protein n=1 Tax=Streptomyces sp. NPDC005322 TaxID=3157032 RepID=UPI0033A9B3C0